MAKRRERAKLAKEYEEATKDMTPEELEEYMEEIPEWKRGALQVVDSELKKENKKGLFGRTKDKLQTKLYETKAYQDFKESEDYQKLKDVKKEY